HGQNCSDGAVPVRPITAIRQTRSTRLSAGRSTLTANQSGCPQNCLREYATWSPPRQESDASASSKRLASAKTSGLMELTLSYCSKDFSPSSTLIRGPSESATTLVRSADASFIGYFLTWLFSRKEADPLKTVTVGDLIDAAMQNRWKE